METINDSNGIRGAVESLIGGREENQDSYGMAETPIGLLIVVCDGMGGGPAGKTASSIAVEAIIEYVASANVDESPASVLEDAAVSANESILAAVAENPALKGMGTTCVCVLLQNRQAFIMHVGDSRCYQLRGDKVVFRTADHSYVGEMVRRGTMTEEEARTSNYSNVITRALGAGVNVDPEIDFVDTVPGDRFALMTDGIWGMMTEPQLAGLIGYADTPATMVAAITARVDSLGAADGGGHDNLTLALVDLPITDSNSKQRKVLNDMFGQENSAHVHKPKITSGNTEERERSTGATSREKDGDAYNDKAVYNEQELLRKNARHRVVIVWLTVALILAIGLIACLFVYNRSNSPEPTDVPVVIDTKTANADTNVSETKTVNKTVTVSQAPLNEVITDVIKTLESLKSYKPTGPGITMQSVIAKRVEICGSASEKLKRYASAVTDTMTRKRLEELSRQIDADTKMMKRVDGKYFHSQKEANDAIDKNIKDLRKIKNNN